MGILSGCSALRPGAASPASSPDPKGGYVVYPTKKGYSPWVKTRALTSSRGIFRLPEGEWLASLPQRVQAGFPLQVAINSPARNGRISLFETSFPSGTLTPKDCDLALAYLFKLDRSPSPPSDTDARRFSRYLPPEMTEGTSDSVHLGLGSCNDTGLIFVHAESEGGLPLDSMAAWADTAFLPGGENPDLLIQEGGKSFLAAIENTLGLQATEDSAFTEAMRRFKRAFALDSANPRYLANIAAMEQAQKHTEAGLNLIKKHGHLLENREVGDLWGVLGGLYEELGDFHQARQCAIQALERDPGNREWLINLSDALWGLGEKVQSKNVLLGRYALHPDFRLSVYLAGTYLGLEEYENARAVLERAHQSHPPDSKSAEYALRALIGLKDFASAQGYAHALGEDFPRTPMMHFLLGVTAFNLKQYLLALQETQTALNGDPGHREAQELSTQITALLGGKSNHILRTPLTPLKTHLKLKEAAETIRSPAIRPLIADFPLSLIDQHIVFSWAPGQRWRKTRHQIFFIPDGQRLLQFSELNYELNPTAIRFFVNRFRIYDTTLQAKYQGSAKDFYVTGNHNSTLHPENLLVHLPVKAKAGPQFLEVITTEEAQVASNEFPYLRYDQQAVYPMIRTRFDILHPPANAIVTPRGECVLDTSADRLTLMMDTPMPPLDRRLFSPPPEFGSGFSVSALTTWREVGNGYWNSLTEAGINPDSLPFSVREKASEIAGGLKAKDPVRSLFAFARDSVRYNNYEFSLQAQIPDPADHILQRQQADCKGHSLLLMQMLKSLGYSAYLFLVDLDHPGEPEHPDLNQFNHMIVYFPSQKGHAAAFLDATEKFMAYRRSPLNLEGRIGLIVDKENSRLATIPEIDSAQEHQALVFHHFDVRSKDAAMGTDSIILSGKLAAWFREHYHSWNPSTRKQTLISWMSEGYPPFMEKGFRITGAENPDTLLNLVFHYEARFPMQKGPREIEHFPKLELSFLRFPPPHLCRQPMYFANEVVIRSEWTYHLPDGYVWKSTDIDREVNANYLHWKFSIQQNVPESILIRQRWQVDPFVADPMEYGRYYTEWSPILARSVLRLAASKP